MAQPQSVPDALLQGGQPSAHAPWIAHQPNDQNTPAKKQPRDEHQNPPRPPVGSRCRRRRRRRACKDRPRLPAFRTVAQWRAAQIVITPDAALVPEASSRDRAVPFPGDKSAHQAKESRHACARAQSQEDAAPVHHLARRHRQRIHQCRRREAQRRRHQQHTAAPEPAWNGLGHDPATQHGVARFSPAPINTHSPAHT